MYPMQNLTPNQQQTPLQNPQPPMEPKPEYRFRWEIFLGIPLTIAIFIYIIKNIEPSFHFNDLFEHVHITQKIKYTRLACMGVLCIAFLIIAKLFRNKGD
jgi:uncharacterized integral membrane protein